VANTPKSAPNPRIAGTYEVSLGPKDEILFEVGSFCVIRRSRSRQKWPQRPDMPETIYWLASRLEDDLFVLLEGVAPRTRWQATRDEMIEKCRSLAKMAGAT
jgi:hypothetical protein